MDTCKILLAEDDVNLGKVLTTYLEAKGFSVMHANNGEVAYEMFCSNDFGICLVDVMMPIQDGFTLAKSIRKVDSKIPIIFLTAKTMQEDILEGLSIGDDYVTKPFSMEVLLARIQSVLRRVSNSAEDPNQPIAIGTLLFDPNRQTLSKDGVDVERLTTREVELLAMLLEKKNGILERGYALKKIWGDDSFYNARSMDVYIAKLRGKFKKHDPNVKIVNVHSIGFKIVS
ncbi:MAG: response regulator transcription factor [Bacteroidales bacterium]|jgi:DNA-binding response OmpR family regulator|nr:response regulator transcription factor [Bacteroidales bacterium]MCR5114693.1 response regulator transcription factor [Bacteroidales bacterium]